MHFAISIANLMNKFALLFSGYGVPDPDSNRDGMVAAPERKTSGCGVIGSRARLRIWCRKAWGFESLHPDSV